MKLNWKMSEIIIFVFLLFILSAFSGFNLVEAAAEKEVLEREARVSVRAEIPIFQRLEIVEEPNINYSYLMDNYNGSNQIILKEALSLVILSNTGWHLRLNNRNLNYKVMIKKSNQSNSEWQNLNSTTSKFRGENGVHQIKFDLKFVLDQSFREDDYNLELDLRHNLVPELY